MSLFDGDLSVALTRLSSSFSHSDDVEIAFVTSNSKPFLFEEIQREREKEREEKERERESERERERERQNRRRNGSKDTVEAVEAVEGVVRREGEGRHQMITHSISLPNSTPTSSQTLSHLRSISSFSSSNSSSQATLLSRYPYLTRCVWKKVQGRDCIRSSKHLIETLKDIIDDCLVEVISEDLVLNNPLT